MYRAAQIKRAEMLNEADAVEEAIFGSLCGDDRYG